MNLSDSHRFAPHGPPFNGVCGGGALEATGDYPSKPRSQSAATQPGGRPAGDQRFDFLTSLETPGEVAWLDHYRVVRPLGNGGMGLVFLAEDTLLSRPVALKVMRPELADTEGIAQRFMREARATAAIKDDHIVTIYQVGQHHGLPYLAMEYLTGSSLAWWLERGQAPSGELVLRLGREIALGLSAAHRHGLIHRDIKPANLWLEAPAGRVKILDFGMARSQREDVEITHAGAVMGTPAYMAPEQARGDMADASSDLFSLGCVMYRLWTGRLPFEGETVMAVLSALANDVPRRPVEWRSGLPLDLDDLIMRLLAKDPADRPPTAEIVVREIRAIERALRTQAHESDRPSATPSRAEDQAPMISITTDGRPASSSTTVKASARRDHVVIAAALLAMLAVAALATFSSAFRRGHEILSDSGPTQHTSEPATLTSAATSNVGPSGSSEPQEARSPAGLDRLGPPVNQKSASVTMRAAGAELTVASAANGHDVPATPRGSGGNDQRALGEEAKARAMSKSLPPGGLGDQASTPDRSAGSARHSEGWGDVVDPDGDCKFVLEPREDRVTISVPGKAHLLSAEVGRVNAPQILRDADGDFDLSVRIKKITAPNGKPTTTVYSPYHGAGLVIWQDQDNYIRLEIAADLPHGKPRPYVNFEYRKDGVLAFSGGLKNPDGFTYLRLKRRGDEILASFGPDEVHWTSFAPITAKLENRLKVGVAAINSSTKTLTAEIEGFDVVKRTLDKLSNGPHN
jgi:serine/threonine protein kinase/regulation of enolase protein 1 (concanavalin A-like superfamily)